jgi:hypothetical protein
MMRYEKRRLEKMNTQSKIKLTTDNNKKASQSLLEALQAKDTKAIKYFEEKAVKGEIIRLI